jgi:hypothetical protein
VKLELGSTVFALLAIATFGFDAWKIFLYFVHDKAAWWSSVAAPLTLRLLQGDGYVGAMAKTRADRGAGAYFGTLLSIAVNSWGKASWVTGSSLPCSERPAPPPRRRGFSSPFSCPVLYSSSPILRDSAQRSSVWPAAPTRCRAAAMRSYLRSAPAGIMMHRPRARKRKLISILGAMRGLHPRTGRAFD